MFSLEKGQGEGRSAREQEVSKRREEETAKTWRTETQRRCEMGQGYR